MQTQCALRRGILLHHQFTSVIFEGMAEKFYGDNSIVAGLDRVYFSAIGMLINVDLQVHDDFNAVLTVWLYSLMQIKKKGNFLKAKALPVLYS